MGEVRLLLIGAGRMGQTHLRALRHSHEVTVVAVADPSEEALAAATEIDSDLRAYGDLAEALAAPIDGVLIAAPSTLHRRLVAECADRGLPILCEKPCGVSTEDIDAASAAAERARIPLQVGYWRRYVPELIQLREQLRAGRFGELLMISCWQWDGAPPDPAFRGASGGIVIDMAVHELDQLRWLTGDEPTPTSTVHNTDGEDPDCATALLQLSDGATALVSLGRHFPHGDCVWVELMGTADHARVEVLWGEPGDSVFLAALRAQTEDFARTIRQGGPGHGATAIDARRALELAEALSG